MRRHTFLSLISTSTVLAGCRLIKVEAGFKQPAELRATAEAGNTRPVGLGRLAFVCGGDIWVKDLPDGEARRLTQDGHNSRPRWSPSGDWLAFQKEAGRPGPQQVWVIRRSGEDGHPVETAPAADAVWSPAADRLAFTGLGGLFTVGADGSDRQAVVAPSNDGPGTGAGAPVWSFDGQWLAYVRTEVDGPPQQGQPPARYAALWRARADGSAATELLNGGRPSVEGFIAAGWSPDGAHVLYWPVPQFSSSLLADGTALRAAPVGGGSPVEVTGAMLARRDFIAWAPDGQTLALVDGAGRATWQNKAIAAGSIAGGLQRWSDAGRADLFPAWAPAGTQIAFTGGPATPGAGGGDAAQRVLGERRVWVMEADGSGQRALTSDPAFRDERPRWSADGTHLLFARLKGEQAQLWLMRADGSDQRPVVDELTPSPDGFGFYGYLDWGALYDWWHPKPAEA
ncbi:MAG: TolB family protein [Chloroflexota bacterium]